MKVADAKEALFRAPHAEFVAERKRLAGELKAAGHKDAGAALLKTARPLISTWAVNQLWWVERETFDAMLDTAKKVRKGDLSVMGDHKAALAALRTRAAGLLVEAGNAAADATLHRVGFTLSAIAARGDFGTSEPGMLSEDLEAPGFASLGIVSASVPDPAGPPLKKAAAVAEQKRDEEREAQEAAEQQERQAADRRKVAEVTAAEKKAAKEREHEAHQAKEAARAARERAEREKLEAAKLEAVAEAAEAVETARAEVERLEAALAHANKALEAAQKRLATTRHGWPSIVDAAR